MASAKVATVPCASMGATMRPTPASVSVRQASFFGPRLTIQRAQTGSLLRAREAVKVEARSASKSGQQVQVDIDKPLGLQLEQGSNGLRVKSATGNAAKAGIQTGDTVIYTSSFFGDELWPADKLGFARSAIQAAPSPVTVVVIKGENTTVDVKRLPKKPAPARFGRKLTAAQKARATHICIDCGYIYADEIPFSQLPADYSCPQCNAPKRRFAGFDPNTGKMQGGGQDLATIATVVGGLVGVAVLGYLGLSL